MFHSNHYMFSFWGVVSCKSETTNIFKQSKTYLWLLLSSLFLCTELWQCSVWSGPQPTCSWNGFFATALLLGVDRMMCCDRRSDRLLISKSNIHHPREVPVYRLRPPPPDQRVIHRVVYMVYYTGVVYIVYYMGAVYIVCCTGLVHMVIYIVQGVPSFLWRSSILNSIWKFHRTYPHYCVMQSTQLSHTM